MNCIKCYLILVIMFPIIYGDNCSGRQSCSVNYIFTSELTILCDQTGFNFSQIKNLPLACLNDNRCSAYSCTYYGPCIPCRGDQIAFLMFGVDNKVYYKKRHMYNYLAVDPVVFTNETYVETDGLYPGDLISCRFTPLKHDSYEMNLMIDDQNIIYHFRSKCPDKCANYYNCTSIQCLTPQFEIHNVINGTKTTYPGNDAINGIFKLNTAYIFYLLIQPNSISAYYDTFELQTYALPRSISIRNVRYVQVKGTMKIDYIHW